MLMIKLILYKGIQHLIKPNVMENQVEEFVWNHIIRDVDDMHISLGVSVDDVMLLMHAVVNNIFRMHNEGKKDISVGIK